MATNFGTKYIKKNSEGVGASAKKAGDLGKKSTELILKGRVKEGLEAGVESAKEVGRTYAKGLGTVITGGVVSGVGSGKIIDGGKEPGENDGPAPDYSINPTDTSNVLVKRDEFTPYTPKTTLDKVDSIEQNSSSARANQLKLLALLEQAAAGNGPSAAQAQLQAGNEANIKAAMSQAASAKGPSQTAAARQSIASSATANQQTANQAAMLRAQEMQAAYGLNAQVAGDIRNTDTQISLANMQKNLQFSVDKGKINSAEAQQIYDTNARAIMQNAQSANNAIQNNADRSVQAQGANYAQSQDRAKARVELNERKNKEVGRGAAAAVSLGKSEAIRGGMESAQGSGQATPAGMNLAGDTAAEPQAPHETSNPAEMTPQQAEQRRLVSRPTATDVRSNPQARLAMLQRLGLA